VDISVRQLPADQYYHRLSDEVDNLFDYGWVADYPDPENVLDVLFHSGTPNNVGAYANAQVDGLLEEARAEQDVERRMGLYRQAEELLLADAAAIPLWYGNSYLLVKPYVKGYALTAHGLPDLKGVSLELDGAG
jgi:oligopeptide transport system substrate-binding protein